MNPKYFETYPWATYKHDNQGGVVFCGICCAAKEQKCDQWMHDHTTKQDAWVNGIDDWGNIARKQFWSNVIRFKRQSCADMS